MARSLLEGGVLGAAEVRRALEHAADENCSFQASLFKLKLVKPESLAKLLGGMGATGSMEGPPPAASAAAQPASEPSLMGAGPAASSEELPTGMIQVPHGRKEDSSKRKRLGELLVDKGMLTEEQLAEAIAFAAKENILLGTALVTKEFLTEEQLSEQMLLHSAEVKKLVSKSKRLRLGDILLEQRAITQEQLTQALEHARTHRQRLGEALIEQGVVKDRDIAVALSKQMALPYVNLAKHPPDPTAIIKVPKRLCLKNELMPFRIEGKMLTVALVDPLNVLALDDIQNLTGLNVLPVIITKSDFDAAVKNYLGEEEDLLEMLDTSSTDASSSGVETGFTEDAGPIVSLINKMIATAVQKGASDIHIDPAETELRVRFRVDGVLTDIMSPPKDAAPAIASRIKVLCNLDIAENRLPQDGKFRMKIDSRPFDFRVSVLPVVWGQKIVIRLLDQSRSQISMDELGMESDALKNFRWGIHQPNGIVLVTGPTGSGKSTTLYSALFELQDPKVNIHTAEDPVEFSVTGITQVAVKPDIGLTFASALRSFLRQDPDVILLGEIRDLDSANIAFKAAMTGHLVLSTLHTNDAIGTIDRLITMGIDRFVIASSLKVILAQRLIRKLCTECREDDPVPREQLLEWGLTDNLARRAGIDGRATHIPLKKPVGCRECNEGYKGRMGIHEVLAFSESFREMLIAGASNFSLQEAAVEEGMLTLRDSAMLQVLRGISGLDEVTRLTTSSPSKTEREGYRLDDADEKEAPPGQSGAGAVAPALSVDLSGVGDLIDRLDKLSKVTTPADFARPLSTASRVAGDLVRSLANGSKDSKRHARLLELFLNNMKDFADNRSVAAKETDVNGVVREQIVPALKSLSARARLISGNAITPDKLKFTTSLAKDLPQGWVDTEMLQICLEQVLVNSLCFLKAGGRLGVTTKRVLDGDREFAEISVLDSGPGLEKSLGEVTQPGISSHTNGLGLGLAIVQRYISQMKGRVEIKSKPGKGCLVKFRLPAR